MPAQHGDRERSGASEDFFPVDLTRLSIIEPQGNARPKWSTEARNSRADWLGIGVTSTGNSISYVGGHRAQGLSDRFEMFVVLACW